MEIVAIVFMIVAGLVLASIVIGIASVSGRSESPVAASGFPERDCLEVSLLYHVARAGSSSDNEALRAVRRCSRVVAPVRSGIDVASWGGRFAAVAAGERERLLETAVRIAAGRAEPVPLMQYVALLDLSFALGFQTDTLARLRERHPFEYVDHARAARPREADRAGRTTFFERSRHEGRGVDEKSLLALLELEGTPSRHEIIAAYRKVAARHHPDRFHDGSPEERDAAAARFIELTRGYEELLAIHRE